MALRPPRALRGWWRYPRLVGWRLAVLAVAAGSSVARAAGVAGRLGGTLATGAVRAVCAVGGGSVPCVTL